jgi:hypothetical protein
MTIEAAVRAKAAEGKPYATERVWRGWAAQVLNIYAEHGYVLRDITHHMEGDRPHTSDIVYDFVFEKK